MISEVSITITSKKDCYKVELKNKVTVITGHSGRGKSQFAKATQDDSGVYKVTIKPQEYKIVVIGGASWYTYYSAIMEKSFNNEGEKYIFIFDDTDCVKSVEFAKYFKSDKKNLYMVINRFIDFEEKSLNQIPYSAYGVFTFCTDGRNHWLEHKYKLTSTVDGSYDCVVTEDTTSGLKFLRCYNKNISTSDGKDSIVPLIQNNRGKLSKKKILVFADLASFGSIVGDILSLSNRSDMDICLVEDYQCFEYLLLTSNLLKNIKSKEQILAYAANLNNFVRFSSLEKLYESLLQYLTKGTVLNQGHGGDLNTCYYLDCRTCKKNRKKLPCKYGLKGSKQKALIQGTQWEEVLTAVSNSELIPLNQE